jgi:hypothetical protein
MEPVSTSFPKPKVESQEKLPGKLVRLCLFVALLGVPTSAQKIKVIVDQDARGPATTDMQSILIRQDGTGCRRIEADRASNFRVPKINSTITIDWGHPPSRRTRNRSCL